jgi:hypothetical protein
MHVNLSKYGRYLEELGQGIQHVASRVASLPEYVERCNDYRAITGDER